MYISSHSMSLAYLIESSGRAIRVEDKQSFVTYHFLLIRNSQGLNWTGLKIRQWAEVILRRLYLQISVVYCMQGVKPVRDIIKLRLVY